MKGLNVLIGILLLSGSVFGQCIYQKNEVDKFTGKKNILTKKIRATTPNPYGTWMNIAVSGNDKNIFLNLQYAATSIFTVKKGAEVIFLFSDGTKVIYNFSSTEVANHYSLSGMTSWYVDFFFLLNEEEQRLFSTKTLTDIRVYTTEGYVDMKFKKNKQQVLRRDIVCVQAAILKEKK